MNQTTDRQAPPIHRAGSATQRSPDASAPFWVEMLVENDEDGGLTATRCTLDPGTMTRWHTHPHGQILYALSGVGLAERDGDAPVKLRAGDCITFAPGERHRHGATPGSTFAYISIQAAQNGSAVTWLED
ncbi:cupin domain-containing protein [Rhizobium mayense]|uniref:Cupin domain-containing protein n=1 Tax=Rhizobium mayense TaxID=1312184 RepID=A0ABT7JSC2_9HYPH|nr:cupin domain-containing protein [Rhizobium mayense]MDL2399252.1 cupin domain-containing protein [Rhizobium mayense]